MSTTATTTNSTDDNVVPRALIDLLLAKHHAQTRWGSRFFHAQVRSAQPDTDKTYLAACLLENFENLHESGRCSDEQEQTIARLALTTALKSTSRDKLAAAEFRRQLEREMDSWWRLSPPRWLVTKDRNDQDDEDDAKVVEDPEAAAYIWAIDPYADDPRSDNEESHEDMPGLDNTPFSLEHFDEECDRIEEEMSDEEMLDEEMSDG